MWQVWSDTARSLLQLRSGDDWLECDPALPARLLPLELRNVSCRGGRFDVEVDHHGWRLRSAVDEL